MRYANFSAFFLINCLHLAVWSSTFAANFKNICVICHDYNAGTYLLTIKKQRLYEKI